MAAPDLRAPNTPMRERPLSPHLQVYTPQVQMMSSIIHRITGVILAFGGLGLVYALVALASGPERWGVFAACAGSLLGKLVLFGFSWALAYHLINGVRHLAQDAGHGFEIKDFIRNSWISFIGSVVLVVVVWVIVLMQWGQP